MSDLSVARTVRQLSAVLEGMKAWFDEAEAFAKERGFDASALLQARLFPDQFPLVRQVQVACDTAKLAVKRLTEVEVPSFDDDETTFEELRGRIDATVKVLRAAEPSALEAGTGKLLSLPMTPEDKRVMGADYFVQFVVPNFHFHAVTAYSILRANGVLLGKQKFLAQLTLVDAPAS